MPLTSRMSIDAVAVAGITFDASAPTCELDRPLMLSDGNVITLMAPVLLSTTLSLSFNGCSTCVGAKTALAADAAVASLFA